MGNNHKSSFTRLKEGWLAYNGAFTKEGKVLDVVEVHAYVQGHYFSWNPQYEGIPDEVFDETSNLYNKDIHEEPHYARGGYIHAEYVKIGIILLFVLLILWEIRNIIEVL